MLAQCPGADLAMSSNSSIVKRSIHRKIEDNGFKMVFLCEGILGFANHASS